MAAAAGAVAAARHEVHLPCVVCRVCVCACVYGLLYLQKRTAAIHTRAAVAHAYLDEMHLLAPRRGQRGRAARSILKRFAERGDQTCLLLMFFDQPTES